MLSAAQRFSLRQQPDFFKIARRKTFPWGSVWFFTGQSATVVAQYQGSVIARKSIFKTAVQRHRVKRQWSAYLQRWFSAQKNDSPLPQPYWRVVVIPKRLLLPEILPEVTHSFTQLLKKTV